MSEKSGDKLLEEYIESIEGKPIEKQEGHISICIMGEICDAVKKKNLSRYYDADFGNLLVLQKDKGGIIYFSLEEYRNCSRGAFKKFLELKESEELEEYKDYKKIRDEIFDLYKEQNIPDDEKSLKEYIKKLYYLGSELILTTVFCESMDHELALEIAKSLNIKNPKEFIKKATIPCFESFLVTQDKLILNKQYDRWMFADYYGAPKKEESEDLINNKIKEKNPDKIKLRLDDKNKEINKNKKELEDFRKNLSDNEKKLLDYIQLCMELRDKRKETIQKLIVLISDSLIRLAEKYSLKYHDLSFVGKQELDKLSDPDFMMEIKKRVNNGAIQLSTPDGSKISSIKYDYARNKINKIISGTFNELKGITAQVGNVKGTARVILSEKDFRLFNEGDILVTSMTRPEFVPLMRKARAVVTDEGGVTCHAAIISRELKIPCVIGTRTATIFIKDGDEVEVDADKGVVRIIKDRE